MCCFFYPYSFPLPPCQLAGLPLLSLCLSHVLYFTYHWARQASIRSSCCSAVGLGSSEWLALYPGSCWALLSTAPYLYQQNASFSLILFFSHNCAGLQWEKVSGSAGRHKKEWKTSAYRSSEAVHTEVNAACKVKLDAWTHSAIVGLQNRWEKLQERLVEIWWTFYASVRAVKTWCCSLYYRGCWDGTTGADCVFMLIWTSVGFQLRTLITHFWFKMILKWSLHLFRNTQYFKTFLIL